MQPPSIITLQQRSRRLSADLETPISLFLSLTQNQTPGLLLESAEVDGRWGRYSVIACDYLMTVSCVDARLSLSISDDRLASLKELEKAKSALEKDSQLQKLMAKSRMSIVIHKSCIELYCTDGTSKGFDSWLSANQYENLNQERWYQKDLPTDSDGL